MTLRIQQPQIHPDWPWEEVAITDDDESVLENRNGQHHGCDRSGSLWGVVPLFKLSSGQQKSLRARPGPVFPPHRTSGQCRIQLIQVLFPTWWRR